MKYFVGIDLGTSSVKTVLMNTDGKLVASETRKYPIYFPENGWSEQNPEDWYNGTVSALEVLLSKINAEDVLSFSFSGQMHGLVMLDNEDKVIRPALLWNDSRSAEETAKLNEDRDFLLDNTGNIAFAGFTLPKLLWVRNHEKENFAKINKIMLPKDYVAYRLSGSFCTDVSDASGTLYFDCRERCWADRILERYGIKKEWLPKVLESDEIAGELKPELMEKFGTGKVKIVIGAGDNAAAAVGTGTVKDGDCNISLGTSGTVFTVSDTYCPDRKNAIHAFCSAGRNYHYMACMLSAAVCCNWWNEKILGNSYDEVNKKADKLGENNVFFLPYLMGERSPLNDTHIRGMFTGLDLSADKNDMSLAVLEGVAFALRHNIETIEALGVKITKSNVCGGGSKNKLWLKIIASVLNMPLNLPANEDGAATGAAMLAAKGVLSSEEYKSLERKVYVSAGTVLPDKDAAFKYNEKYKHWKNIYPAVKGL